MAEPDGIFESLGDGHGGGIGGGAESCRRRRPIVLAQVRSRSPQCLFGKASISIRSLQLFAPKHDSQACASRVNRRTFWDCSLN